MRCVVCNSENPNSAVSCSCCGSPLRPETALTPALPVGTRLQGDLYSIGKVLGQGGFGITYLGSDTGLKRAVAIKEFFPQVQGCSRYGTTVQPGGMITHVDYLHEKNKFLAEGQRLAQFQHPSIVKVFSLFEENNTAYMVMEFLRGKTLLKIIEEDGRLEEKTAIAHVAQIAEALDVIHGSKLLHRDIKPENIIITEDGRAVLVDFGTAREFAAGKTRRMTTTLTPGYAPLEQYGQRARFGVFTDIYALGATLYHLLTEEMPIHATDRATGVELPALKAINPKVSRNVSDAVMWALEMRVEKRPQTIGDFLMAMKGTRPCSPIPQSEHTRVSTRPETGRRIAKGMGWVEVRLSRSGPFPLDCPVTINVGRRASRNYGQFEVCRSVTRYPIDAHNILPDRNYGQFEVCRSVTVTRERDSVRIELAGGEYQFSATCTVAVKDALVFATKILTSDPCHLIVPTDQIVTLRLERRFDDLYLTGDKACLT
jgi:serine/threonine protein kinase